MRPAKSKNGKGVALADLSRLWQPVRPYLAQQASELYGCHDGRILEIGPFSGVAFELARRSIGTSFYMAVFPAEIVDALKDEARGLGVAGKIIIAESDEKLRGVPTEAFDLAIFRGAFFFPAFFKPDLPAVYRSLKAGGMALLGGGFGRYTPEDVIRGIEKRSKELNQALGRVRTTEKDLWSMLDAAGLKEEATVICRGRLMGRTEKRVSFPEVKSAREDCPR